jgi:hypothetical protein
MSVLDACGLDGANFPYGSFIKYGKNNIQYLLVVSAWGSLKYKQHNSMGLTWEAS